MPRLDRCPAEGRGFCPELSPYKPAYFKEQPRMAHRARDEARKAYPRDGERLGHFQKSGGAATEKGLKAQEVLLDSHWATTQTGFCGGGSRPTAGYALTGDTTFRQLPVAGSKQVSLIVLMT